MNKERLTELIDLFIVILCCGYVEDHPLMLKEFVDEPELYSCLISKLSPEEYDTYKNRLKYNEEVILKARSK